MAIGLQLVGGREASRSGVSMDERELVRAARAGDERAFADLVKRHSPGLHRAVARVLSDDSEAWDVVQMAFLRAWQRFDRYDERWSFATWLYRIGTNLAIDLLRSRKSRERAHQASGEHQLRVVETGDRTTDRMSYREVDTIMRQLVHDLSPQQRAAFVLREIEGQDTADVAAALGCSPATVRNHVFQARKVLKREMARRFPEYLPPAMRG
jgi:RNA polymerase sigma-70 factor (ECF subfamily)